MMFGPVLTKNRKRYEMKLKWQKCEICKDLTIHIDGECKICNLRIVKSAMLGMVRLDKEERQKTGYAINNMVKKLDYMNKNYEKTEENNNIENNAMFTEENETDLINIDLAIKHARDVACGCDVNKKCADDHRQLSNWLCELKELRFINEELKSWINDLHSGMYINCVYCGHRYGPKESTPCSMSDVLKEHVENCVEHPMYKLKKRVIDVLSRNIESEIDELLNELK